MKVSYVILTNKQDYGKVIKRIIKDGQEYADDYIYNDGEWELTGCMLAYTWFESPLYERYEEITEEEAMKRIAEMK